MTEIYHDESELQFLRPQLLSIRFIDISKTSLNEHRNVHIPKT